VPCIGRCPGADIEPNSATDGATNGIEQDEDTRPNRFCCNLSRRHNADSKSICFLGLCHIGTYRIYVLTRNARDKSPSQYRPNHQLFDQLRTPMLSLPGDHLDFSPQLFHVEHFGNCFPIPICSTWNNLTRFYFGNADWRADRVKGDAPILLKLPPNFPRNPRDFSTDCPFSPGVACLTAAGRNRLPTNCFPVFGSGRARTLSTALSRSPQTLALPRFYPSR